MAFNISESAEYGAKGGNRFDGNAEYNQLKCQHCDAEKPRVSDSTPAGGVFRQTSGRGYMRELRYSAH
ncbi:MAG: hypothetical protein ACLT76_06495 [Clostridium fessum]